MFSLGVMVFVLLEQVLQWRNQEISENIGIGIKQGKLFMDINKCTIKTIHNSNQLFIVNSG